MRAFWGAVIGAALLMASAGVQAQEKLRVGHVLPKGSQFSEAVRVMNEELQRRTNNKYVLEEHPASVLGSGPAMLDAVKLGTIDMVLSSSGGALAQFNPNMGILDLMLLFRDEAHADLVLDGPIGAALLDSFKDTGTVALGWAENGFRQLTNSLRPIKTPADLKGMKMRIAESELYKQAFLTLGAEPFTMPFAQLYPALKSGQAEAEENPVTTIVGSKLYEVQSHITISKHTYSPGVFLINKEFFDELSPELKTAFIEAARAGGKASREYVRSRDREGMNTLKTTPITITTDFDRAAFETALEPFYKEAAKKFTMEKILAIKNAK
ncbi:TRAP transporter substrate-binding protein [Azospirillum sp. TSO35-2]|uniref:TRAP transporter substrate-binding protein n=1 Tax=Azospirillum sp. TSO35-2 TaxID=716796 RepID=UPI000D60863F|nr:TRAP transporter substrate-binding protein [Azospirillum sp. TSO35-2]PWC39781.1 hypothetical protein TSO352_06735 [Azospirillum sp. TSO35-2]